jgi:hypothetical protein
LLWGFAVTYPATPSENDDAPLVRPFVLAHLAEVERGEGRRRALPDDSQIVTGAAASSTVTVVLLPNARHAWGYSPVPGGGS